MQERNNNRQISIDSAPKQTVRELLDKQPLCKRDRLKSHDCQMHVSPNDELDGIISKLINKDSDISCDALIHGRKLISSPQMNKRR